MTIDKERLRVLAEAATWTGKWYDAGCNTVHCTYDKEDSIQHDVIAHPVPLGVSGYIAAAHPQAVLTLLDRIADLEAQLESIGAGGVHGPLIGCASPPTAQAEGWISVDERLPEPDGPVLAHNGKWTGVAAWMSGEYLEPLERWQDEHREFIEMMGPAITHWMPLPLPPTSAEGVEHG